MLKEWIKGVTARLRDKLRGMLQRRPVWHPSTSAPPCNLSADLAIRSRTAAALHLQSWRATSCVRPRRSRSSGHSVARCSLPHMSYKAATMTSWQFVNRNLMNKDTFIARGGKLRRDPYLFDKYTFRIAKKAPRVLGRRRKGIAQVWSAGGKARSSGQPHPRMVLPKLHRYSASPQRVATQSLRAGVLHGLGGWRTRPPADEHRHRSPSV